MRLTPSLPKPVLIPAIVWITVFALIAQNALTQSNLQSPPDARAAAGEAGNDQPPSAEEKAPPFLEVAPQRSANLNTTGLVREDPEILRVGAWIDSSTGLRPSTATDQAAKFLPGGGLWQSLLIFDLAEPLQTADQPPGRVLLQLTVLRGSGSQLDFAILPLMGDDLPAVGEPLDPGAILGSRGSFAPVQLQAAAPEQELQVDLTRWIRQAIRHGRLTPESPRLGLLMREREPVAETAGADTDQMDALAVDRASARLIWNPALSEPAADAAEEDQNLDILAFTMPDDPLRLREGPTDVNLPPETRGWVDVTDTPFTVDPTGQTDATESLQLALTHHAGFGTTLFLPNGTYLLSEGISVPSWSGDADHRRHTHIVGQSRDGVILKLAPNTPRFGQADKPGVVLDSESSAPGLAAPVLTIENLTIQISEGNPGAVGLRLAGGSGSALRNIRVLDEDPQNQPAYIGILLNSPPQADVYLENLEIAGFQQGLVTGKSGGSVYAGDLELRGQAQWGIWNRRVALALQDVRATDLPGFLRQSSGATHIFGGQVTLTEGAAQPLLDWKGGRLLAFKLNLSGTPPIAAGVELREGEFFKTGGQEDEVIGQGSAETLRYLVLQDAPMTEPLRDYARIRSSGDLPEPADDDRDRPQWEARDWAVVNYEAAQQDAAGAIQQALESGKPAIWLPFGDYAINRTLSVPTGVREIAGGWSTIRLDRQFAASDGPVWLFPGQDGETDAQTPPAVLVQQLFLEAPLGASKFWFDNQAGRSVTLRDVFLGGNRAYLSRPGEAGGSARAGEKPQLQLSNVHRTVPGPETPGFSADWDLADHHVFLFGTNPGNGEWLMPGSTLQPFGSEALFQAPPDEGSTQQVIVLEPLQTFAPEGAETDMIKARLTGLNATEDTAEEGAAEEAVDAENLQSENAAVELNFPWIWTPVSPDAELVGPYSSQLTAASPENLLPFPNVDDLRHHPPRHYRLSPLARTHLDPESLRALQPIVAWDNEIALEEGLLRHYRFDDPANPAADSGPQRIDGIAVNLQLEPPRDVANDQDSPLRPDARARTFQTRPRVRLAQEGSQLVVVPEQTNSGGESTLQSGFGSPQTDPARAVAMHLTALPGGNEPRGLLYEEGDEQTGGFALWIAEDKLHAAAQLGVSTQVVVADLEQVSSGPLHVVAQFHLGLLELFIDGRRVAAEWAGFRNLPAWQSAALGMAEGSAPSVLTAEQGPPVPPFLGLLADLRVYHRALNPGEIRHLADVQESADVGDPES